MRITPTLAAGFATTLLGMAGCSAAPSGPEAGPPQGGADSIAGSSSAGSNSAGSNSAGSNSAGGSGSPGSPSTGGSGAAGETGGGGSDASAGRPSSGEGGASAGGQGGSAGGAGLGAGGSAGSASGTGVPGCPEGAFMCEGFEDYPIGAPGTGSGWMPAGEDGEVTIDATRAHSGKNALHVTGTQKQCGRGCGASIFKELAVPAKTVFVRYMMYTVSYPASQGVHTRVITMGTSRENGYSLATYNGTAVEKVNAVLMRDTATNLNDSAVKNRWVCWEFSVDATGGVGKVVPKIWLDGRQLSLSKAGSASHGGTTDSWDPIPYEKFYVGLWGWQADPVPADYWIDDMVVHSERLSCPASK